MSIPIICDKKITSLEFDITTRLNDVKNQLIAAENFMRTMGLREAGNVLVHVPGRIQDVRRMK